MFTPCYAARLLGASMNRQRRCSQAMSAAPPLNDAPTSDAELSGFDYATRSRRFTFSSQSQDLQMAYLD